MSAEHDIETTPGLPGMLPAGEHILWQGAPVRAQLARTAFHTRLVTIYFGALTIAGTGYALPHAAQGFSAFTGPLFTIMAGLTGLALLHLFAFASARSTIYTLTNRRIVLRAGIALPTCINIPLSLIEAADLRSFNDGTGDIPLRLKRGHALGYAQLWPHARPWHINHAQPMLRSIPDASRVATLIARATGSRMMEVAQPAAPARDADVAVAA
jgi:hypothetical protein